MTTKVIFIRHGQTAWNVARRWQGHSDIPLDEVGIAQSHALARRIGTWPIQTLYSSDLKRAAMTADILGQTLQLEPHYDSVWRERDVGALAGLTHDEIQEKFPQVWARMQQGFIDPPQGERQQEMAARATSAYQQLITRHEDEIVAVVSHGGTIGSIIAYVLGIPKQQRGRFSLRGNTGLNIIEVEAGHGRLVLLNDTCHLDGLDSAQS